MAPPPPPCPLVQSTRSGQCYADATDSAGIGPLIGITYQSASKAVRGITVPVPKSKMKTVNWVKVPNNTINAKEALWKDVSELEDPIQMDYDVVEELFSRKTAPVAAAPKGAAEKKQPTEINLFDMKRSMSINVWLKQFKMPTDDIIEILRQTDEEKFGAERLRSLLKLLPDDSEVEMLRSFDGDKDKLGAAEKFCRSLIALPSYALRVEGMLTRSEFQGNVDSIQSKTDAIVKACQGIITSRSLKLFLKTVLHTCNFINSGSYAGNAVGFKVSSLSTLWDTQANKRGVTLLHHLVEVAENQNQVIIEFVPELSEPLQVASRLTLENIVSDNKQLCGGVTNLEKQLKDADSSLKEHLQPFMKLATKQVEGLNRQVDEINQLSIKLCQHLCEDEKTFRLEDCLKIFYTLCENVKKCQKDNERRRQDEERATKRKKEQENKKEVDEKKKIKKTEKERVAEVMKEGECLVDKLLDEIRRGTNLRQRATR